MRSTSAYHDNVCDWVSGRFGQPNNLVDVALTKRLVENTKPFNQTGLVESQPKRFGCTVWLLLPNIW
jgi:hypothetical protein